MAKRRYRPGRNLIVFFLGVAILYGLVALAGTWKPALGLDLQGGTRITLSATGDPSGENLEEARRIIDERVNGSGVSEAEVTTQAGRYIVVEIPGSTENRQQLENLVKRQAQLRFRLVACSDVNPGPCAGNPAAGMPPVTLERAPVDYSQDKDDQPGDKSTRKPKPTASPDETGSLPPSLGEPAAPEESGTADPEGKDGERTVEDELAWMSAPEPEAVQLFNSLQCAPDGTLVRTNKKGEQVPAPQEDVPDQPLVACEINDDAGPVKYLLSRAVIEGTELTDASAGIPQGDVQWVVNLEIGNDDGGEDDFEAISQALVGSEQQFAIVLDGNVLSAPTMEGVITNGRSQISGDFTETSATNLATSLKYGALPIAFEDDPTSEAIGPSLAGDQLTAGLTAGAVGLALVMLYCLLYYRGLGLVVVSSLFVAAAVTYGMVLLLSETAGFTLTLPGIAGLIIAVGITADSFVIYFERIRDEMREGKSMRVAVETGWARARVTRIAANTVSLLSALVLYLFATGVVKGFGFALGLSTLVDLAVLFWFTKPMVSWLAQFKIFNSGHKLSGLSRSTLGLDGPTTAQTAGGKA
jgi:preprotein translocase subunit SecD